jgi:hypothetical protein
VAELSAKAQHLAADVASMKATKGQESDSMASTSSSNSIAQV